MKAEAKLERRVPSLQVSLEVLQAKREGGGGRGLTGASSINLEQYQLLALPPRVSPVPFSEISTDARL